MAAAAPLGGAAAAPAIYDFFPFAALPHPLALKIFAALPADTRLRCAEVCRGWRGTLAERSLWTRLDVSDTSGVTHKVTPALLRAAAAKAGGGLTALDVSGVWQALNADDTLREVLAANAGTLRELRCLRGRAQYSVSVPVLEALLSAAPQLRVCEADVLFGAAAEARRALRNEGVFGPLRVHVAWLQLCPTVAEATTLSLFADVAAHASLSDLELIGTPLHVPEMLDAFVDAALSLPRLRTSQLYYCSLSPASVPALACLLGSGTLTKLGIYDDVRNAFLDAPAAVLLGGALRANATLTSLTLSGVMILSNHAAAAAMLGALTGHSSLRKLSITGDERGRQSSLDNPRCSGMLLGTLIAADAPVLTALDVSECDLHEEDLRPLFEALPGNTHLRTLDCSYNYLSDEFAADVLLPAVRANTSLRALITHAGEPFLDAALEAEALVKSRSNEDTAA
jgi:hypothetical protein